MNVTLHVHWAHAEDGAVAVVLWTAGREQVLPMSRHFAPTWVLTVRDVDRASALEYSYALVDVAGRVTRRETGDRRAFDLAAAVPASALHVDVDDGHLFAERRTTHRVDRCLGRGQVLVRVELAGPLEGQLEVTTGDSGGGEVLVVEGHHRAWTHRGHASVGTTYLIRTTHRHVRLALVRDGHAQVVAQAHLLVKDELRGSPPLTTVLAFVNAAYELVAQVQVHVSLGWPLPDTMAADVVHRLSGGADLATHQWPRGASPAVGHRGFGSSHMRIGVAENTLLAFQMAHRMGVRWVEFDVQLLADGTPVVFHDLTVPVSDHKNGPQCAVSQLTMQQLQALTPRLRPSRHRRSGSDPSDLCLSAAVDPHMVHDPFLSLAEMFGKGIDDSMGFNLEIKHAEYAHEERLYAERNGYVDRILECVARHAGQRKIFFSTFDPDICLLLRLKQNRYPVMFLTTGGKEIFPDQRRNSLDSALVWARACGLRGIVCDVAPLLAGGAEVSAHFVNAVHAERMLLWTYGRENNDLAVIKQEKALGIDAIILDAVKRFPKDT